MVPLGKSHVFQSRVKRRLRSAFFKCLLHSQLFELSDAHGFTGASLVKLMIKKLFENLFVYAARRRIADYPLVGIQFTRPLKHPQNFFRRSYSFIASLFHERNSFIGIIWNISAFWNLRNQDIFSLNIYNFCQWRDGRSDYLCAHISNPLVQFWNLGSRYPDDFPVIFNPDN